MKRKAMMTPLIKLLAALISIAAQRARATYYSCVCDVNHPQGYIFDCPSRTQVIGAIYRPDDVLPYHSIDLQGPYCKAILSNVMAPDGFLAVLHNNQIGYLEHDSGYVERSCSGQTSFHTGLTTKQPLLTTVITTKAPQRHTPGWISVVQKNNIHCKGSSVQNAVDQGLTIFHSQARSCGFHGISASESVLLTFCDAPADLKQWNAGLQVVRHCPHIAKYTPVSKFDNNQLQNGNDTGIFLECTATGGFKMIRQTCNSLKLEVATIELGLHGQYHDAEKYFVVF